MISQSKKASLLKTMRRTIIYTFYIFSISFITLISAEAVTTDSTTFSLNTRLSFYSYEENGELLLLVPEKMTGTALSVEIFTNEKILTNWKGIAQRNIVRIPFLLKGIKGSIKVKAQIAISSSPLRKYEAGTTIIILSHKPNEVKTDRLTGGLIVNRLQFFPFGFYCYSPVHPLLPEEEVIRGFNVMSPYQKILPETVDERKKYIDRCAMLGMKVHYNLLSVSGGGGVGSKIEGLGDAEKRERLINEIKTFRDHPALLAWYISDEPDGKRITPDQLAEIYRVIKENDPWHPVSIVFMAPYTNAIKYEDAMDIVMADPYPVPDFPVTLPGNVATSLKTQFRGKKPVWIVPQAFGGGEIWRREPTPQEARSMTWQSIINGATGIQYFVRQGPDYFPKSTALWSECSRIAVEVTEMTPWLLSDETANSVQSSTSSIQVASRLYNGRLAVFAVNKINEPLNFRIQVNGIGPSDALVLFEDRIIKVNGGQISDQVSPYGSKIYLIDLKKQAGIKTSEMNLLADPGFEDLTVPGIPSACYVRPGGDRGATFFLDTRVFYEGSHSLKIVTPADDKSLAIRFFPFYVKAGSTYLISMWAKSDPEQRLTDVTENGILRQSNKQGKKQFAEVQLGDFGSARFYPDDKWRRFVTFMNIPADTLPKFKTNLILKMPGQGVAWFDMIEVTEDR